MLAYTSITFQPYPQVPHSNYYHSLGRTISLYKFNFMAVHYQVSICKLRQQKQDYGHSNIIMIRLNLYSTFCLEPVLCYAINSESSYDFLVPGMTQSRTFDCFEEWNVILRRQNNTVDFERTWSEYATGFGEPGEDLWIGNQVSNTI